MPWRKNWFCSRISYILSFFLIWFSVYSVIYLFFTFSLKFCIFWFSCLLFRVSNFFFGPNRYYFPVCSTVLTVPRPPQSQITGFGFCLHRNLPFQSVLFSSITNGWILTMANLAALIFGVHCYTEAETYEMKKNCFVFSFVNWASEFSQWLLELYGGIIL